ncbi:MAG: hypothetical protein ABIW83_04145, partial [Allosphingosinicella sp.]
LHSIGVSADEIGGALGRPVSSTSAGKPAQYFVIHDTSTPNLKTQPIPAGIDSPSWKFNKLDRWKDDPKAHIFIARTGGSLTTHDYSEPWRATKTESCVLLLPSKGLFLHHELVQPRRSDPDGKAGNDHFAPEPPLQAITDAQLDRLALAYVAASLRARHWLVPAFHATIDQGIGDGHDDPQGFRLSDWATRVAQLIAAVKAAPSQ